MIFLACYSFKFPFDSIILFNLLLFCLLVSFCRIHISSKFTTCDYEQSTNDSLPLLCFASKWGNKSCRRSSTPRLDLGKVVTNVVWIWGFEVLPHVINMAYFKKSYNIRICIKNSIVHVKMDVYLCSFFLSFDGYGFANFQIQTN